MDENIGNDTRLHAFETWRLSSPALTYKTPGRHFSLLAKPHDLILTHKEALAGSPQEIAVCGEEDTGSGLEFLVRRDDRHN